tara:strand:+ start:260 stop:508 length:249 start_codon:yes stop_codon:yes gene_type:complete
MECFVDLSLLKMKVWNKEAKDWEYKEGGNVYHPVCPTSRLLAKLAGNEDELTSYTMDIAKQLGYTFVVFSPDPNGTGRLNYD